jgi:hypothetical protein
VERKTYSEVSWNLLGAILVDHLVTSEEAQGVGIVLERLDDPENALEVTLVVRAHWVLTVQALAGRGSIDVENHVDAGGVEDGGTVVMVGFRVDVVHTDGIDLGWMSKCHTFEGLR